MAIDIRTKTQEVVEQIDSPGYLEQIEQLLPEGVTLKRFVSVAKTAVRTNSALATAEDQTSLFGALLRCAQDGLLPDGREAALVIFKGKVGYIPMIGGVRKIAAVFGWAIRTSVVYENDEFDYTDEPPVIHHRSVRPGADRGALLTAYAVATHRDGRRMQTVLHPDEIAKRRATAQTDSVWKQWTPQMYEKTAGHDIFKQLPLDPNDARVSQILRDGVIVDPVAALYGDDTALRTDAAPPTDEPSDDGAGSTAGAKPEEPALAAEVGSSNDLETAEEGVWTPVDDAPDLDDVAVEKAALQTVKGTVYNGQTFAQIAASEDGATWFLVQLKRTPGDSPGRATLETFVQGRLPDVWARYQAHLDNGGVTP